MARMTGRARRPVIAVEFKIGIMLKGRWCPAFLRVTLLAIARDALVQPVGR